MPEPDTGRTFTELGAARLAAQGAANQTGKPVDITKVSGATGETSQLGRTWSGSSRKR